MRYGNRHEVARKQRGSAGGARRGGSTADYRWMVLPRRPADTEDWDEARLAALVREGDMIGVTVPVG